MPDAVSLYDTQGKLLWLNRTGRQSMGSAPNQQTMEEMSAFYSMRAPSGDPLQVDQLPLARALRGETITGMEMLYGGGPNINRLVAVSAAPLTDIQGQVETVVMVSHDLSMLRQAEHEAARRASELAATTNLLEAVIEAITDGVFIYDQEGRAKQINSAGRSFLKMYSPVDDTMLPVEERTLEIKAYDESVSRLRRSNFHPPESCVAKC